MRAVHFYNYLFSGFNSGVMGAMILLGNVSGAAVGTCFTVSINQSY